ncbi:hypothetical protein Rhe02_91460 [Rhizocola hellebori]|uniref:DUF3159 domain-containing protein n=1 Tax=Rhizocola hellebori TaxID=1392758 RepID=A0A8J3VL29_9ACTN|nr:DUF3159 domain-containing protein [Rhizocola hellebori]GIH11079.1 hypothetical protein Rhe02_91460 [Rhizocola hellebori]
MKPDTEELPPFAEQMAQQLGGWRGLVESGVPVAVFVLVNVVLGEIYSDPADSRFVLQWAIGAAVAVALTIAVLRFARKQSIRFAVNGLFGIALGAYLAWNSGEQRDFYLPGIFITLGYVVLLLGSTLVGHPLVGWIWTVVANEGKGDWRAEEKLKRTFTWLTALWAAVFFVKFLIQGSLYLAHYETALGVSRIALSYPPFALLLAITIWAVRRVRRQEEQQLAT